jgi:hypothetical protein
MTLVALVTTALWVLTIALWRHAETENAHLRQEIDEMATINADLIRVSASLDRTADAIMAARLDAHNERVDHPTFGAFGRVHND